MNTTLQHHGILGQKWGVRRYQNYDGSLTNAGRIRYSIESVGNKINDTSNKVLKKRSSVNKSMYNYTDQKVLFSKKTKYERMLAKQEKRHKINKSYKKSDRIADEKLFNVMHKNPKLFIGTTSGQTAYKVARGINAYGNGGRQGRKAVRRISKRMDKGDSYQTAFKKEMARQASVRAGKEITKKILITTALPAIGGLAMMKLNEKRGIKSIVQNHYYDPIDITDTFKKINN